MAEGDDIGGITSGAPGRQPEEDLGQRFDRRAALLLVVLLIVGVAAVVIINLATSDPPLVVRIVASLGVVILAIPYLATIRGLGAGKPWARAVAAILLGLIVLGGLAEIFAALGRGGLTIPFAAIAAIAILGGARGAEITIPEVTRPTAAILVVIALVGTAWPLIAGQILRPGGSILAVDEGALDLGVDVDCGATAEDGSPRAAVTVSWRWRERDLVPGSTDGVLVDWSAPDDGVILESTGTLPDGVWEGSGSPAANLTARYADGTSWEYGIDVERVGQIDGQFGLVLVPSVASQRIAVTVLARYAHLDRWITSSSAETCEVPAA